MGLLGWGLASGVGVRAFVCARANACPFYLFVSFCKSLRPVQIST